MASICIGSDVDGRDIIHIMPVTQVPVPGRAGDIPLEQESDKDLARKSAKGDDGAFAELFRRHRRRVYSICLRMLQNATEAEDLAQDVFIQLHRKIGTFRGDSAFTTWLHRLTVNQVLMHFRKRSVKLESIPADEDEAAEGILDRPGPPPAIVERIALEDAIGKLPHGYRRVFTLHDVEGFEHEEVARILGCSVGTSKSQLHKARLKMQRLLARKANPRLLDSP